jgi:Protein of unknown function (DUF2442)
MRTEGTSRDHRSFALVPPIVCNHPDDVAEVHVVGDYRIQVRFNDGTVGIVDLSQLIRSDEAGVFAELREPHIFSAVAVDFGAVTWPGGIDLAPDAMYAALRSSGEWILA